MAADYDRFWASVAFLADTFRSEDPLINGNVLGLAEHLRHLPTERQAAIRSDLQLLGVHFEKLPIAISVHSGPGTEPGNGHPARAAAGPRPAP